MARELRGRQNAFVEDGQSIVFMLCSGALGRSPPWLHGPQKRPESLSTSRLVMALGTLTVARQVICLDDEACRLRGAWGQFEPLAYHAALAMFVLLPPTCLPTST